MQKSRTPRILDDTELTQAQGASEAAQPKTSPTRPLTGIYFLAADGTLENLTQPK